MSSPNHKLLGLSVAAIAIAIGSIFVATFSFVDTQNTSEQSSQKYSPQTREIYLFSQVDEHIEDQSDIPPDQFSLDSIVAKKGDKVKIHFYNLEPVESQEHHTFSMNVPYEMNHDINAGEDTLVEFTALESGVFDYFCTFHQPTMRGQLVILDS